MDAPWKENMPPRPGGHLKSGRRLVQKNVGIRLSVGSRRDTMTVSCQTERKRTTPAILPGLGPGRRLELGRPVVSRKISALVQTNLAPAGQPLQDALSLVSHSNFEQQTNLQPRAWRPRAAGKWRGFFFHQSHMKLGRTDPERRKGHRRPQPLEEPDGNLEGGSRQLLWPRHSGSAPWPSGPNRQTHGCPFLRDQPSLSFSGLGNTVQVKPKTTKAQEAELSSPPWSGHQECPVKPRQRLQGTLSCWPPGPMGRLLTSKDLGLSGRCHQSAHPQALGSRAKLSPESAGLLLSMRYLKCPTNFLLLRASQDHSRPWLHSNWDTSPEVPPTLTPEHSSPLTHPYKAVTPEATSHLTPGYSSPLLSHSTVSPVISPDLTPRNPSPLLSHSTISPVISPDLIPEYPSPLTHPCNAVPPETTPHLTPGFPSPLTHPYRAVPLEATPHLKPGHLSLLTHPCRAVPPEVTPHLTPGNSSPLLSHSTVSPVISPDLIPEYPSPLTHPCNAVPPETTPHLIPGFPSPLTHPYRAVLPEATPHLTPGRLSLLTHPCRAVPPEVTPHLTPGNSSPLLSHSTVNAVISPDLTPGHPLTLSHSTTIAVTPGHSSPLLSHSTVSPVVSPDLILEHPSPLTYPCKPVPTEATPHLTPGHPKSLTLSHNTTSPVISLDLTPVHPSPLTLSHSTTSAVISPDLTPGPSSSLTLSHSTKSPLISPDLTPRHPSPLLSHSTISPVISPDLIPEYPSPLTHPCNAVPTETTPDLTPRHSNSLTLSHRTMSPMISPDMTPGPSSSLTLSHSTISTVISPDLTPGHSSPLLSHSTISPVISPDLISENPSPLIHPCKAVPPETTPHLTPGHPSPLTLSHSTTSPVISPERTPRYPCPLSLIHGPVIPEVSLSMTPGYPKLHTVSSKTLAPEGSPCLTLSHRARTPEASPNQRPENPSFSGPSSQIGFPNLKLGWPKPLTLSGSTWTPGKITSSPLSHDPQTPDPSPSFFTLPHNAITPVNPPNLALGYSSPHILSDKATTVKASPKLTPGCSRLHLHPSKTKVPEVSTNLGPGYPSPLISSHRNVTPETSPSLGYPQGIQQLTRALGIPKTQDPGTKELGDFRLPSSGDGHDSPTPSFSPGTSGMNVLRVSFPQLHKGPCSVGFPQAFCDKLSLPSGRGTALEDLHQAVPASSEGSSLPMSGTLACTLGSHVNGRQGLMETQLEEPLGQVRDMLISLVPQDTNGPLPGPKEGDLHWESPEKETPSVPGGGSRRSLLKKAASGPHLSGQESRLGSRISFAASSSAGMRLLAPQQCEVVHRHNEQESTCMEQHTAGNRGAGSQSRTELDPAVRASQQELELEEKSELLAPEARESRALLTRCFKAWLCHLLRQRAVAWALWRRHLLRKGIRAMRWCLWLREAQMEYMKRKQGRAVLAKSFQKWKDLYSNRREEKLLTQSRTETPREDLPSQGGHQQRSFVTLGVVCGVEGAPKIQLCPRWKSGGQDLRAPATRDLQRLAAFYLWYLQKVLEAELRREARARAELRKKKLRRVFQAWQARTMNTARICHLVARHQRAQLDRCFGAWRLHTQKTTWCRGRLAHWRVETLRKSLQQWVKMARLQAMHLRTVNQLYLLCQRRWHLEVALVHEGSSRGPVTWGPREQDQPCYHPEVRAKGSLEEACRKLKLHRVIMLWSRRLSQHQRADTFFQTQKLRLLQSTLQQWWLKARAVESSSPSSSDCPLKPSVDSQDSEGSPASSGFLRSALAPLGPSSPRSPPEKAHRPADSSSSFLILAGDDLPRVLPLDLRPLYLEASQPWRISFPLGQRWPQLWEWQPLLACPPPGEETGPWREAVQVPRDPGHLDTPWPEAGWQQGSRRALEAKQHGQIAPQSRVICSWNLLAVAPGLWWELVYYPDQEGLQHWRISWQSESGLMDPREAEELLVQELSLWGLSVYKAQDWGRSLVSWEQDPVTQGSPSPGNPALGLFQEGVRGYLPAPLDLGVFPSGQEALQELGHKWTQHGRYILKRRAYGGWPRKASIQRNATSCQEMTLDDPAKVTEPQGQDWRTVFSEIYHARQHCLPRPPWAQPQMTMEEQGISVDPGPRTDAAHPQRLAIRGYHILCADPNALGKQITALAQAKRKPPSHTGQRTKSVSLGGPELSFLPPSFPHLPLHCSFFPLWLQLYRKQSRAKGLTSQEGPKKSTRQEEEGRAGTIQTPKSRDPRRAASLEETWLTRKYLQRWRHEVLLRRFHGQRRKRQLAEVWQCWIDAQGSEQLARMLFRQRSLEWGWGTWRRRWLQLRVALCFQEDHRALSQAFGRWYQQWAARVLKKGGTSQ